MNVRPRALLALTAVSFAALAYACTVRDFLGVPVWVVTVEPSTRTLIEGATFRFTVDAQDENGNSLPIGAINWSTDHPQILTIGQDGTVEAVSAGQTTVRATLEGTTGQATVTVQPGPTIVVDTESLSFFGAQGAGAPDPATVQISNGGGGTLGGLAANVQYGAGGPTGWLNPSLVGTTAPTSLTVSISGELTAGTYDATILLSSGTARNSPVSIPVEVVITLDQPLIAVNPTQVEFEVEEGAAAPAPKIVQVTNVGGGVLSDLEALVPGGAGWLSASLNSTTAPTQVEIQPDPTGLAVGTYQGDVTVASDVAINPEGISVAVILRVIAAPKANIGVAKTGPATATVGDTVVFVVTTTNAGPDEARAVTLIDSLPAGLEFWKASGNGVAVNRAITWSKGTLASGATQVDSVWATVEGQGILTNVARVSSTSEDPQPGMNAPLTRSRLLQSRPISGCSRPALPLHRSRIRSGTSLPSSTTGQRQPKT